MKQTLGNDNFVDSFIAKAQAYVVGSLDSLAHPGYHPDGWTSSDHSEY